MKHKAKHYFIAILKYGLFWGCLFLIYTYFLNFDVDFSLLSNHLTEINVLEVIGFSCLIILLSFLNWYFEVLKWHQLVSSIKPNQFRKSVKVTLMGHSLSMFTPAKSGDFIAKYLYYSSKGKIIKLNLVHQYAQFFITLIFGFASLFTSSYFLSYLKTFIPNFDFNPLLGLGILLIILILFFWKYLKKNLLNWLCINSGLVVKIHFLSVLKYLSFSLQYAFFIVFFVPDLDFTFVYPIICIIYLLSSIIPVNYLIDVGIKTTWGVLLFSHLNVEASFVILASFLMWILNFAVPGFLGAFLVLKSDLKHTNFVKKPKWFYYLSS